MSLVLLFSLSSTAVAAERTLTFGVVPQQSAKKLARLWTPILAYLESNTGYRLVFKTAKDIPTFERRLAAGEYDIAYMNPYHYTVFHRDPGYQAFAKEENKQIKGIVVVRKDSPLVELNELAGQRLAFPSPAAFAASVLPRAKLSRDAIEFSPQYVSSHDSVYLGVARGLFTAGGGVVRTFRNTNPEVQKQLRVLWTTKPYTPHAFAAHSKLPYEVVAKIREAMVNMDTTDEGKHLLGTVKFKGIEPATNADWDDVRALGIELLDKLINSHVASADTD